MPAKLGGGKHRVEEASANYSARLPIALLDVNVWVALMDDAHVGSVRANEFLTLPGFRIAICPMTENGAIRVLNLPSYGKRGALGLKRVHDQIAFACSQLDHTFWSDDTSLLDDRVVDFTQVHGHQ